MNYPSTNSGIKPSYAIKSQMVNRKRKRFPFVIFAIMTISFLWIIFYLKAELNPISIFSKDLLAAITFNKTPLEETLYSVVPEYDQTMEKVVISLAPKDTTLVSHYELLKHLPQYTQIVFLVPDINLKTIEREFNKSFPNKKLILVPYKTRPRKDASYYVLFPENDKLVELKTDSYQVTHGQGTIWARDLFVAVRQSNDKPLLLVPEIHKWFISYGKPADLKVVNDNSYLYSLSSHNIDLIQLPLIFQGGNILVDRFENKKLLFVGVNALRSTRTVRKSTSDSTPSDEEISSMIKKYFRSDEIIVVGKNRIQPPSLMFHLDQAMIILDEGIVGVTNIVGQSKYASIYSEEVIEVELFLENARTTLLKRGYKVIDIDTSVKNIVHHQQYVNAIPYINKENSRRILLMPLFSSSQTNFDKKLIKKNTEIFRSLNYDVIHVPTDADKTNGGIHCLINVVI